MPHSRTWLAVLVAGAALTLAACDKSDNRTAGEKLDSAVAKTEQAADTAAAKTERGFEGRQGQGRCFRHHFRSEGRHGQREGSRQGSRCRRERHRRRRRHHRVRLCGLAKDPDLSAIKINVDTKGGAVSLKGPAPSAAAKARAEEIAKGVQGVTSVDNQLDVKS
jgi:hyperosmotically inducible protein